MIHYSLGKQFGELMQRIRNNVNGTFRLTSSKEAFPALSPIPFIVTSNCLAPEEAP